MAVSEKHKVIITSPSLDPRDNVSGVSSVTRFIIDNNKSVEYIHFLLGKKDTESSSIFSRLFRLLGRYREWKKLLRASGDVTVHFNFPMDGKSIIRDFRFLKYVHKRKQKLVVHIHGGQYLNEPLKSKFLSYLLKRVFSLPAKFVVLSSREKDFLVEQFSPRDVYVLPNCVEMPSAESFVPKSFTDDMPLNLVYLGRIEERKGIGEMLSACKLLKGRNIPFVLNFAGVEYGREKYVDTFREALGDSFRYHGIVSGQSKASLLEACDVFLLPSWFEGLPMSLIECMGYGMIPVVTPVGSIPSAVEDGVNGIMVPVKDVQAIANAIEAIHRDRKRAAVLASNARETAVRMFDASQYVEKLNEIYGF